jgi:hypothetical protein
MKMRERDTRPKHQFKLGDTAEVQVNSTLWNVVVLEARETDANKPPRQLCKVILGGREDNLHAMVRNFIARKTLSSNASAQGYEIPNTRMKYTGVVPPEWLASITSQDISNIRFEAILDD